LGSNNNQVNGVTVTHHTSKDTSTGLFIGLNSKGNTFSNITANLNENGIYLYFTSPISETSTHTFTNTTVSSNAWGIIIQEGASSYKAAIIEHSHIENNSDYGIYITSDCPSQIYNNILSNTTNTNSMTNSNEWNVSKQLGDNIYDSNNPYIGGNYWTNPSATGYSDTCVDSDTNGFCDAFYSINADNIDNLPLSDEYVAS